MITRTSLCGRWALGGTDPGAGERRGYQSAPAWEAFDALVPGAVPNDLVKAGLIPDPRWCRNPDDVSWVGRRDWWLFRRFIAPPGRRHALVFHGVDTFAEVFIDGEHVASLDNQFVPHEIDVTDRVKPGVEHSISVKLEAPEHATARIAGRPLSFCNGWYHRLYARKAQMSYGWDWARYVPTLGILRPVEIIGVDGPSVKDVWIRTVSIDGGSAVIEIAAAIDNPGDEHRVEIEFSAASDTGSRIAFSDLVVLQSGMTEYSTRIEVRTPALWWPLGYGRPALYRGNFSLRRQDSPVASMPVSFGIRQVELVLEKDGCRTFFFRINGRDVFCQGANWVPLDVEFTSSAEKYRAAFEMLKHANLNMLRVWGGGIIEDPLFYDLADSNGVMLWHDMMFACGEYPRDDEFRDKVKAEVARITANLRNHPSVVLWCGNNENAWLESDHPLYTVDLPDAVRGSDPDRPYWPSSPYSPDGMPPNSQDAGDCHDWACWHGARGLPAVEENHCLFLSEYGCQAPPDLATVRRIIPEQDIGRLGPSWSLRMGVVELLACVGAPWIGHAPRDMHRMLKAMWCAQREIDCRAYYLHRSRMLRADGGSGGVLVWAFGEAWPAVNWSILDYLMHPKAAYYGIRRACRSVSMTHVVDGGSVRTTLSNQSSETVRGVMTVRLCDLSGAALAEASAEVAASPMSVAGGPRLDNPAGAVVSVFSFAVDGAAVSDLQWLVPVATQDLPDASLAAEWLDDFTLSVRNDGGCIARMVQVRDEVGCGVLWNDDSFDLLPGEGRFLAGRLIPGMAPYRRSPVLVSAENCGMRRVT
ncbi:MAG: hypothetical protein JW909_00410 [Planctomycetes bacterium]|nr:hypothetical protein [Planctomycetota bacterium]